MSDLYRRLGDIAPSTARTVSAVGIVLADVSNSLFIDIAHGAQREADDEGTRLLLGNAECTLEKQDDFLELFNEAGVGGVLMSPMEDSAAAIDRARSQGRPVVMLNFLQPNARCCTVLVNNHNVGFLAARHLLDTGRRQLAFVAAKDHYQPVHERRMGVRQAVAEVEGASLEEIDSEGLRFRHGFNVAAQLSRRSLASLPDGIVAVTDDIGNGVVAGLHTAAVAHVPDDTAVVGCEDNRFSRSGPVLLTTVHLPGVEMGRVAFEILVEEIREPETHFHRTVILNPRIILRASTAAAGRH